MKNFLEIDIIKLINEAPDYKGLYNKLLKKYGVVFSMY
jgi:hypothetical protein